MPRRAAGRRRGADRLRDALALGPPRARRAARLQADEARGREELYPAVLRAAARVSVVVRCVRGIDERGLHVTNIEALSSALERLRAPTRRRPASSTASRCATARCRTAP